MRGPHRSLGRYRVVVQGSAYRSLGSGGGGGGAGCTQISTVSRKGQAEWLTDLGSGVGVHTDPWVQGFGQGCQVSLYSSESHYISYSCSVPMHSTWQARPHNSCVLYQCIVHGKCRQRCMLEKPHFMLKCVEWQHKPDS